MFIFVELILNTKNANLNTQNIINLGSEKSNSKEMISKRIVDIAHIKKKLSI